MNASPTNTENLKDNLSEAGAHLKSAASYAGAAGAAGEELKLGKEAQHRHSCAIWPCACTAPPAEFRRKRCCGGAALIGAVLMLLMGSAAARRCRRSCTWRCTPWKARW
ncbi:hypothetical protein NB693_24660 [Pantoea ananatis]|uniref:hypothetical protein n=1 Tax=Pantoea ananas TaxID=553 RepID=UPI00221E5A2C|nr:hypothetical protein [Pantoea ananatis]